jgi:hypothetical protein
MGAYIKSPYDTEICDMLTARFSDTVIPPTHPAHVPSHAGETFIGQLRRHRGSERLFNGSHALERVSHRLAYSVNAGPVPATSSARLRWHWLLNAASTQLSAATKAAICDVLEQVLRPGSTVDLVTFNAQVKATASNSFELDPGNSRTPQIVVQGGKNVCLMMLNCPKDQPLPNPGAGQQPDPPPSPGPGQEHAINNVPVP